MAHASAPAPVSAPLALIDARLIDGTGAPSQERSTVVVDGDPAADVGVLRDTSRIALILQDGGAVQDAMGRKPVGGH